MNNASLSAVDVALYAAFTFLFIAYAVYAGIVRPAVEDGRARRNWHIDVMNDTLDMLERQPITPAPKGGTPMNTEHYPKPSYQTSIRTIEEHEDRDALNDALRRYYEDEALTPVLGTFQTEEAVERALLDEGFTLETIARDTEQGDIVVLWNGWFGYYVFVEKAVPPTLGSVVLCENAEMWADITDSYAVKDEWRHVGTFPSESALLEELHAYGMTTPVVRYLSDPNVGAIRVVYYEDFGFAGYIRKNVLPETSSRGFERRESDGGGMA